MADMKYDILSVQERAVRRKREGHLVINGCAGMLFEDDKTLCVYKPVNDRIQEKFVDYLAYPSVLGSERYRDGVLSWVFQDRKEEILCRHEVPFAVSLGGTGALYLAFRHFAKRKALLLLSDIRWPNYDTLAQEAGIDTSIYSLISKADRLDIASIREKIEEGLEEHPEILLVVNDPCQNPIGYCLDREEYQKLFSLLAGYGRKVTLLLDIAYVDYAKEGFPFFDEYFSHETIPFDIFFAFSASKSFGLYGLRLGALFGLLEKGKDDSDLLEDFKHIARGTYSCANNGAMGPLADFFHDEEAKKAVLDKIHEERDRLYGIGYSMAKVLDELGIRHFPYKGGFYLTFRMENPVAFCQELETKDIYFAPIDDKHVRIAVSGLNNEEIAEFARRMKR